MLISVLLLLSPGAEVRRLISDCQPWWKCVLSTLGTTPAPSRAGGGGVGALAHELVNKINVETENGVDSWQGLHHAEGAPPGGSTWDQVAGPPALTAHEQNEADALASKMLADLKGDSTAQMMAQLHELKTQFAATASPTPPPTVSPFASILSQFPGAPKVADVGASLPTNIPGLELPWDHPTGARLRAPAHKTQTAPTSAPTPVPVPPPTKPVWCSLPDGEYSECLVAKGGCCQAAACIVFGKCTRPTPNPSPHAPHLDAIMVPSLRGATGAREFEASVSQHLKAPPAPAPAPAPSNSLGGDAAHDLASELAKIHELQQELQGGG
jgi:hypothetical protein